MTYDELRSAGNWCQRATRRVKEQWTSGTTLTNRGCSDSTCWLERRPAWMKPYSMDLRERAIGAVLRGGLSRHKSAAQFGVGISTVINWVRRFSGHGAAWRSQIGRHKPKAIAGEHQVFLARRVREGGFTRGLVRDSPSAASRSIIDRCGTSSMRREAELQKNRRRQRARSTRHRAPARPVYEPVQSQIDP